MGLKAFDIFQGNDWTTHRVTVAQAFDTIDRMRELCHNAPALPSLAREPSLPRFEPPPGGPLFLGILELCDDLSGDFDAAEADLFPYLQSDPALRWLAFEMRLMLRELRGIAMEEQDNLHPPHMAIEAALSITARMRDFLRQIDQ
jgi:hypothetical protein